MGSPSGRRWNRKRVDRAELSAGDLVGIGPFVFVVRVDGQPRQIDSKRALESGMVPAENANLADGGTATTLSSPSGRPGSLLESDSDDSSIVEFDFKDDDDAPKL